MIVGQIFVNGVTFSCHRFSEQQMSVADARRQLQRNVAAEQLEQLGRVEIRVNTQNSFDRLMEVILHMKGE